ncbi:hypothetical protein CW306_13775 [Bacillus sp. BA3]|uniref:hypothetical protein n=1 Tax=Bacillus sp. BA3 TaxID=2057910 RepID=UPI000C34A40E|nr:hypothetical protein [Bacillus sp. BA3]PKF88428.1 hypothetical protein CW306_13775 [Bacillus sp. BA3]
MGQQLKMFKTFDKNSLNSLNSIFGEKNIVGFNNSDLVGIKYDFNENKLKNVMQKIPFSLTQQLIITSQHFTKIIENIGSKGFRPNFKLNMEIPDEELSLLNEYIFKISKPYINKETYKELIFDEFNRLEEEYDAELESVSFTFNNERIVFRNNGIVFADENLFDVAGELLSN